MFRRNNPKNQKYCRRQGFGEKLRKVLMHELIINVKIDFRLRQQCSKLKFQMDDVGGSWVEPLPIPVKLNCRYVTGDQPWYHKDWMRSLRWHLDLSMLQVPPANVRSLEMKKFYICSDVTHTHPACSGVWFWKIIAVEVGRTNQIKWTYTMLVYKAAVISLRREVRFELKYLDRFAEAHAFNSSPCVVDFSRCHSCRQSVWKLFG